MKDSINYNYNLSIEEIEEFNDYSRFKLNQHYYYFVKFIRNENEINDIIECSKELKAKGIDCHGIILNKDNSVITKVNDVNYILLEISKDITKEFSIVDFIDINKKITLTKDKRNLYKNNWGQMWSDKVDYFEYQISELGKGKDGILNSFGYYIGMAENAIGYVNKITRNYQMIDLDRINLSHRRLFYPNIKLNYLNPLSFIFDLEVRDIAEYVKIVYFYGDEVEALAELTLYLKLVRLSPYSYHMLYARFLYPSYYFDLYEKIISNECREDKLIKIVSKVDDYEIFMTKVYKLISNYTNIEQIEWLNKKGAITQRL